MPIELEVKILNIEIPTIKQKLSKLQAEYGGGKLMKRYIFDFNPPKKDTWIRLRDNGNTVTLAIKEIVSNQIDGTKELETKVDSLETTHAMLIKMGFTQRLYQENRRTSYKLH